MKKFDIFNLEKRKHPNRSSRPYLEYIISGQPLSILLEEREDLTGCMGWMSPINNSIFMRQFRCEQDGELPNKRVPLYVCSECVDYYCGVYSVKIKMDGDQVIWSDFGYEDGDGFLPIDTISSFCFNKHNYMNVIGSDELDHKLKCSSINAPEKYAGSTKDRPFMLSKGSIFNNKPVKKK